MTVLRFAPKLAQKYFFFPLLGRRRGVGEADGEVEV
jgi:hypothetical protein